MEYYSSFFLNTLIHAVLHNFSQPQIKKLNNILKINWLTKMSSAWITEWSMYRQINTTLTGKSYKA